MANVKWKGGQGGNGDWNTPADWNDGRVPTSADDVTFAIGGLYTVTGGGDVAALAVAGDNVTFDGQVSVGSIFSATTGSDVTLDSNAFFDTKLLVNFAAGSLLDVQGILLDVGASVDQAVVEGINADWSSSAQVDANTLTIADGGTFAGNILLNDGGEIKLDTSAIFGGSTLTLAGNASMYLAGFAGYAGAGIAETISFATAGSVLYLASDPGTVLNLSGQIGGTSSTGTTSTDGFLNITGGIVELSHANNTYTGNTVVDFNGAGPATLILDAPGAAGKGAIFLYGGALDVAAAQSQQAVYATGSSDTIYGAAGGLVVYGSDAGTLHFTGGSVGSVVYGGTGVLDAVGGSGGDTIYSGISGHDTLMSGTGPTTLAGANALLIATGSANNLLAAGGGNTTLEGGTSSGDNTMWGAHTGNTSLVGGFGNDTMIGTGGADTVYASQGGNTVYAGTGYLQLDFTMGFGGGTMTVYNFSTAADKLHLSGFSATAIQDALNSEQVSGGSTTITLDDHSRITFISTTGITAQNFV